MDLEGDSGDLSSLVDHDLSTYATLKTDEMSFERLESREFDEQSFERLNDRQSVMGIVTDDEPATAPKFRAFQKVYARDKDGVMYTAVIRRHLYGPQYHRQVEMGLVTSKEEAQKLLQDGTPEPMWHYFVHYSNWNVNFDRWVAENDVFMMTNDVISYAERLSKEHRALLQQMRKPGTKGKKQWQTVDGTAFLRKWKTRMIRIGQEMNFERGGNSKISADHNIHTFKPEATGVDAGLKVKQSLMTHATWSKAALAIERNLLEHGLTSRQPRKHANAVALPFALKKIIVQQWEIISQCRMMPCLPAQVSIRQALNRYLDSKNVDAQPSKSAAELQGNSVEELAGLGAERGKQDVQCASAIDVAPAISPRINDVVGREEAARRGQEWRDMADGVAMLFDEALASRLLYREEQPQLRVIDSLPEYSMTPFSEVFGCEHLLRLFVRLPEMLADNLSEAEAKPIIAKVNDFVRFLHKNQGTLLTQTHRKLNEQELKEQDKLGKRSEKKRKSLAGIDETDVPQKMR